MPKNAVQRLKKLHNELKNVISIYDEANQKSSSEALDKKANKVLSSGRLSDGRRTAKKPEPHLTNRVPSRKSVSFIPRPVGETRTRQSAKKKTKPDSAPAFSSGLTTISESDYRIHLPTEQKKYSQPQVDNFFSLNISRAEDYGDDSDWSNFTSPVMCEIILSPSKTLETANEILKRNNYKTSGGEESSDEDQTTFEITDCRVVEDSSEAEGTKSGTSEDRNDSAYSVRQIKSKNNTPHKRVKENSSKKKSTSSVSDSNGEDSGTTKSTASSGNVCELSKIARPHPRVHFSKSIPPSKNFKEQSKAKSSYEMQQTLKGGTGIKTKVAEKKKSGESGAGGGRNQLKKPEDLKEKKNVDLNESLFNEGSDSEKRKVKEKSHVSFFIEGSDSEKAKAKEKSHVSFFIEGSETKPKEKSHVSFFTEGSAPEKTKTKEKLHVSFSTEGNDSEKPKAKEKSHVRFFAEGSDSDKVKPKEKSHVSFFTEGSESSEKTKAKEKSHIKKPTSAHEKSKRKVEPVKERRGKSEEDFTLRRQLSSKNKIQAASGEAESPAGKTSECNFVEQTATVTKAQGENTDKEVKALSRILEKNNEKLEKMKVSKELALDMAKQLKDKYDEIRNSKNELLERLQKAEMDNERLNDEVKDEKDSKIKLQQKMEEIKKDSDTLILEQNMKNKEILDENAWLKTKLKELENQYDQEKANNSAQKERSLECKYDIKLEGNLSEENIERLIKEKSELVFKTETLHRLLRERELQVKSLEVIISEYEEELRQKQKQLQEKTERLDDTNKELESIRQNSKDLEEQVKMLRISIESFDQIHQNLIKQAMVYENEVKSHREQIKKLEEENHRVKKDLENAKDSLLIKNKIIDDQQQSLKQQKDKSEEIKALVKKNQSLERIINIEREEKIELQDAVERLKWRKEELKKKVKSLEDDLLMAPQEVVRDLQKTQNVLHELEAQVQVKQKEWELHLQSLIREKEQACSVAEFATKKLMQTTSEFQKQSEAHKRLHKVLAENLAEKEKKFKEVSENVSKVQIKDSRTEQTQRQNWPVEKYSFYGANKNDVSPPTTPLSRWYRTHLASSIMRRN